MARAPHAHKRSKLRLALLALWFTVAAWLIVSIVYSVVSALASGQGPVTAAPAGAGVGMGAATRAAPEPARPVSGPGPAGAPRPAP